MRKGSKHSPETRAKMSASRKGKKLSAETRAKLSESHKGRTAWNKGKTGQIPWNKGKTGIYSAETRAKLSASKTGKKLSAETRAKMSASRKGRIAWNKGKKHSAETRAKMSASSTRHFLGKKHSPETRAKLSAINTGKKLSAETRAKIGAKSRGKKHSAETRAKLSAINTGKKRSAEARAKMSAWQIGRKLSPETRAKIKTYQNKPEVLEKFRKRRLYLLTPKKDTKLELKLQQLLNTNNIQFTKHKPILGLPDIFIEPNICIFADSDYDHGWKYLQGEDFSKYRFRNNESFKKQIKYDQGITTGLEAQGYKVLRLWQHEVYKEPEKCLDRIRAILQ